MIHVRAPMLSRATDPQRSRLCGGGPATGLSVSDITVYWLSFGRIVPTAIRKFKFNGHNRDLKPSYFGRVDNGSINLSVQSFSSQRLCRRSCKNSYFLKPPIKFIAQVPLDLGYRTLVVSGDAKRLRQGHHTLRLTAVVSCVEFSTEVHLSDTPTGFSSPIVGMGAHKIIRNWPVVCALRNVTEKEVYGI